jgi:hypothetical protein
MAITVDRDVHAKVVRAASRDDMSLSAWMTAAARQALLVREGLAAVEAWEAEHGAFSQAELDAARERVHSGSRPAGKVQGRARKPRS